MEKNAYSALGLTNNASAELIEQAYLLAIGRLERRVQSGDQDARNEFVGVKDAYRLVGTPEKRIAYDSEVSARAANRRSSVVHRELVIFLDWWGGRKTTWLLVGLFIVAIIALGRSYFAAAKVQQSQAIATDAAAKVQVMHAENERALIDGSTRNNATSLKKDNQISNRVVDVVETVEQRRSRELEYRANAGQKILDMQQRALEEDIRTRRKMDSDAAATQEAARIQAENRYYTCLNSAINLYGVDRAKLMCPR